ncbi:hypothetical protein PPACK8108_LOCUS10905 [Phakopsora pachyrhizi]|uniref:Uncharacterized protein n=1 Tax=Phakopsora pachyrhizi TaxID=170000 RepID=A0AAV0B494_PHAPC|nr:hypothetical protein PPACK8108_LOCUS10905 [Phakopsora pachyrhizi]
MDWETDEIDLPQNSDCSKLGDQNNKMDEERRELSKWLNVRTYATRRKTSIR